MRIRVTDRGVERWISSEWWRRCRHADACPHGSIGKWHHHQLWRWLIDDLGWDILHKKEAQWPCAETLINKFDLTPIAIHCNTIRTWTPCDFGKDRTKKSVSVIYNTSICFFFWHTVSREIMNPHSTETKIKLFCIILQVTMQLSIGHRVVAVVLILFLCSLHIMAKPVRRYTLFISTRYTPLYCSIRRWQCLLDAGFIIILIMFLLYLPIASAPSARCS